MCSHLFVFVFRYLALYPNVHFLLDVCILNSGSISMCIHVYLHLNVDLFPPRPGAEATGRGGIVSRCNNFHACPLHDMMYSLFYADMNPCMYVHVIFICACCYLYVCKQKSMSRSVSMPVCVCIYIYIFFYFIDIRLFFAYLLIHLYLCGIALLKYPCFYLYPCLNLYHCLFVGVYCQKGCCM